MVSFSIYMVLATESTLQREGRSIVGEPQRRATLAFCKVVVWSRYLATGTG